MVANTTTVVLDTSSSERAAQRDYWTLHTENQPTVEAMMLDSQAAIIDQLERPEVRTVARLAFADHLASMTASWLPWDQSMHLVSLSM